MCCFLPRWSQFLNRYLEKGCCFIFFRITTVPLFLIIEQMILLPTENGTFLFLPRRRFLISSETKASFYFSPDKAVFSYLPRTRLFFHFFRKYHGYFVSSQTTKLFSSSQTTALSFSLKTMSVFHFYPDTSRFFSCFLPPSGQQLFFHLTADKGHSFLALSW